MYLIIVGFIAIAYLASDILFSKSLGVKIIHAVHRLEVGCLQKGDLKGYKGQENISISKKKAYFYKNYKATLPKA